MQGYSKRSNIGPLISIYGIKENMNSKLTWFTFFVHIPHFTVHDSLVLSIPNNFLAHVINPSYFFNPPLHPDSICNVCFHNKGNQVLYTFYIEYTVSLVNIIIGWEQCFKLYLRFKNNIVLLLKCVYCICKYCILTVTSVSFSVYCTWG